MDYEKKYKEALERAKEVLKSVNPSEELIDSCGFIFPELAESEDEQHRKWILEYLYDGLRKSDEQFKDHFKCAISWLEKQKEPKYLDTSTCEPWSDEQTRRNLINFLKSLGATEIPQASYNRYLSYLEKQGKQNLADKVEPKFHEGEWVFIEEVKGYKNGPFQIKTLDSFGYSFDEYHTIPFMYEDLLSKWTIQDAKDGDVLMANAPFIFNGNLEGGIGCPGAHCGINTLGKFQIPNYPKYWTGHTTTPATKEEREQLEKAMADAGYTFDFERKELKKIEQKPVEWNIQDAKKGDILSNGTIVLIFDSVGKFEGRDIINSWYSADPEKFYGKGTSECDQWETEGFRPASEAEKNYLFKMMNKEGYMWDSEKNEIVDIEKPVEWSEEDESMLNNVIDTLVPLSQTTHSGYAIGSMINWLKSLKDRVQPQPKQEWSEEDKRILNSIIQATENHCFINLQERNWLKSLRPQSQWKPSEEQIKNLESLYHSFGSPKIDKEVKELIQQLKAL